MSASLESQGLDDAVLGELLEASQLARGEDLPRLLMDTAPRLGATEIIGYLIDYQQTLLVPLPGDGHVPARAELPVRGTLAGRAFMQGAPQHGTAGAGSRVWAPIRNGAERLGVLEVVLTDPDPCPHTITRYRHLAALCAELLLTRRLYGDRIECTRRRRPMAMPAEIQWNLLPPLTHATERIVISGILEPCYEVAGDTFDYAVDGDLARVAIFDAMGHGLHSTLLASVALGAYRNARRTGLDLTDTYRSIDKWVSAQFPDSFLTGILGEIDLTSGHYRWITAGHHPALLLREGRVVKTLDTPPTLPMGLGEAAPAIVSENLQPADRLLYYTDGVIEARDDTGEFFGIDRLTDFITREAADGLPAPETLRRLNLAILNHQAGNLHDDATTLLVEWRPTRPSAADHGTPAYLAAQRTADSPTSVNRAAAAGQPRRQPSLAEQCAEVPGQTPAHVVRDGAVDSAAARPHDCSRV